jgi:hypothetical protein
MLVHCFASRSHKRVIAFTGDSTGAILPTEYAPWQEMGTRDIVSPTPAADVVAKQVAHCGFFLVSGTPWKMAATSGQPAEH